MGVEGHAERHGVVDARVGVDDQQPPLPLRSRHHSAQSGQTADRLTFTRTYTQYGL